MSSPIITFITGNPNKAAQLSKWLPYPVAHLKLDLDEIQTTDLDMLLKHKATQAYQQIKSPVLVEDVALTFHAFGNLPGPFIKFFQIELGLEKICRLLDPFDDRRATAVVKYGFSPDGHDFQIFTGLITGSIAQNPLGEGGFGWDSIFIPDGYTQTRAQLNETDYEATSPRAKAIKSLSAFLTSLK